MRQTNVIDMEAAPDGTFRPARRPDLGQDRRTGGETDPIGGLAFLLDRLLEGTSTKGRIGTEILIAADLAENPEALRSQYRHHPEIYDHYFNQLSLRRLVQILREESGGRGALAAHLASAVGGGLATALIKRFLD